MKAAPMVLGGYAQNSEYRTEAMLAERQAQDVDLQAKQTSERRREELRAAMSAIEARRAAAGLDLDSPSAVAIQNEVRRNAVRDENVERVGFGNQRTALFTTAMLKRRAGKHAILQGWLNGANAVVDTAAQAMSGGAGGG